MVEKWYFYLLVSLLSLSFIILYLFIYLFPGSYPETRTSYVTTQMQAVLIFFMTPPLQSFYYSAVRIMNKTYGFCLTVKAAAQISDNQWRAH